MDDVCSSDAAMNDACRKTPTSEVETYLAAVPAFGQTAVVNYVRSMLEANKRVLQSQPSQLETAMRTVCSIPRFSTNEMCTTIDPTTVALLANSLCGQSATLSARCQAGFTEDQVVTALLTAAGGDRQGAVQQLLSSPAPDSSGTSGTTYNLQDSDVTEEIEASTTPQTVTLVTQPPPTVIVGELFRVQVRAEIAGSAVPFRAITAVLGDASLQYQTSESFIAQTSGQPPADQVSQWSELALDPSRLVQYTDREGRATFTLRVTQGVTADFRLYFESGSVKSAKTTVVRLTNPVAELRWEPASSTDFSNVTGYELFKDSSLFTKAKVSYPYVQQIQSKDGTALRQPVLRAYDSLGNPTEPAIGAVQVRFVTDLQTDELRQALSNTALFSDNFQRMRPFEKLKWAMTLLIQGARRLNVVPLPRAQVTACWSPCRALDNQAACAAFVRPDFHAGATGWCEWQAGRCEERDDGQFGQGEDGTCTPSNRRSADDGESQQIQDGGANPKNHVFELDSTGVRSLLAFSDMEFEVRKVGRYRMVVLVDGIPSNYSSIIEFTTADTKSVWYQFRLFLMKFLVVTVACLIMVGNSAWHDSRWVIFSLLISIAACSLSLYAAEGVESIAITLYVVTGVIIAQLSVNLFFNLCRNGRYPKMGKNDQSPRASSFAARRRLAIIAYVQRIFEGLEHRRVAGPHKPLELVISEPVKSVYAKQLEDEQRKQRQKEEKKRRGTLARHDRELKLKIKAEKKDKQFKRYHDAFFYPTRMIIAALVSVFSMLGAFSVCFSLSVQLYDTVLGAAATAIRTAYLSVGKLADLAIANLGTEVFDRDLEPIFDIASVLGTELRSFAVAVQTSFSIAFGVSLIFFFVQTWFGLRSFKSQVLAARKGKWSWNPKRKRMGDAANYVGLTISNAIIIFFFVTFIVTIVVLIFAWGITRAIVFSWELWRFILALVIPIIVNIIFKTVCVYRIITKQNKPYGDRLVYRRAFHMYDVVMVAFRLFTGPITALVRAIMGTGVALLTLPFMDRSPIPGWIERYTLLDMGSQAFHAMVVTHHRMSNPIHNVAVEIWAHATFARRGAGSGGNDDDEYGNYKDRPDAGSRHEAALAGEIAEGLPASDAWIDDPKYEAGHKRYVELAANAAERLRVSHETWTACEWGSRKRAEGAAACVKQGLGPMRWHLAAMLIRCPWLREYRVHATMEEREAAKKKRGKKSKYKAGDEEVAAVAGGAGEESSKMEPAVGLGAERESAVALEVGPETPEAPLLPTAPAQQQGAGMQEAKGVAVVHG
eukprot:g3757.t1